MKFELKLISNLREEINRNRRKVMEINYFLDLQRELFDQLTMIDSQTFKNL